MQAFEFHATVQNGAIRIPESVREQLPENVKVIVLVDKITPEKSPFPDFRIDTRGFRFDREEAHER